MNVIAAPGAFTQRSIYHFLNAADGITGNFSQIKDNLDFLDASLDYSASGALLRLRRNDLGYGSPIVALTTNQESVGSYLDKIESKAKGDLNFVFDSLGGGSVFHARHGLNSLSGEIHGTWLGLGMNIHQVFLDSANRQSARMNNLNPYNSAKTSSNVSPKPQDGVWLQALGIGNGRIDSDGNAGKTDYTASGFALGGDALITPDLRFGGAFASTFSNATITDRSSNASSNGYHIAFYGNYRPASLDLARLNLSHLALDTSISYAHFETETSRYIKFGNIDRDSTGDYGANLFSVNTEGLYGLNIGDVPLEPYLGLRYQWLSRDSFQESGAGSVNLIANSQDQHSLRLGAGLRAGRNFSMDNGWFIHPEIRTGWEHEFLDDHGSFTAQFAGTPVNISNFTVLGTRSSRDRAILSAGLSMEINPQIQLYADYSGWISSNEQVHGAIGGFRINW